MRSATSLFYCHGMETDVIFFSRQVISDYQLFAMLGLFISIDLLILMVWEIIDPLYASKYYSEREVCKTEMSLNSISHTF